MTYTPSPGWGGGTGTGGGGGTTAYRSWSATKCSSKANAVKAAGQSIYRTATTTNKGTGQEYASVIATDPQGGIHYSAPITSGAPDYVDLGPVLDNMPVGWTAIAYTHVHPELYQTDDEALDAYNHTHFSNGDQDVAYDYQIDANVIIGGTTDMFSWTPPAASAPQNNYKADSGNQGSVNSGSAGC